MKKILTTILAAFVGIITCIHPVKINADLDNYQNKKSLEEKYYEILNDKLSVFSMKQSEEKSESDFYSSEFAVFNSVNTAPTAEIIEEQVKKKKKEAIINDSSNNLLMYASVIDSNHMKLIIDGNVFEIVADENNVYCVSSSGKTLKIMENITEDPTELINNLETYSTRSGSWVLVTQHLKGTNNMLLQAISEVSTVGGAVAWACGNALFGSIFTITGLFSYVGQKLTVTLYTDYDRYYRSDCTTYIRDYIRFYQYNNYTGYVGAGNSYFHSVRPDYSGQNCMAYY